MNILEKSNLFHKQTISNYFNINNLKDNRDHFLKDQFSRKKKMPELVNDEISYKVINLYKFLTKATRRFI